MDYARCAANLAMQPTGFTAIKPIQERCLARALPAILLVVGNLSRWRRTGPRLPDLPCFIFAAFGDVTADLLNSRCPSLVLSDLIADNFDVTDLARRLSSLGFAGQYRAITDGLPNRLVVMTEVRMVAPDLDFNLLDVTDSARLAVRSRKKEPSTRNQFRTVRGPVSDTQTVVRLLD